MVRLTKAGEAYAHEVRAALKSLSAATLGFRANPEGGTLNLAILPTFGTRWLAPRLPQFFAENPGISINLSTRLAPFDFNMQSVDAAVHFGPPEWPGAELDFLMNETVVPACSSDLLRIHQFKHAGDLLKAPLLHLVSRPDAWEHWFRAKGVDADEVHGMLVDQFAMAAQAAISGLGVALLPKFLIENELARGDLVEAVSDPMDSTGKYYLAWPAGRGSYPPLRAFKTWLQAAVQGI